MISLADKKKCVTVRENGLADSRQGKVGHFIPACDKNGDYSAVQTHSSTGYSWCAERETGKKIVGSEKRFTIPDCSLYMKG